MFEICFASLLHPSFRSALVVKPPAADSSRCPEDGNGSRTIHVSRTGQVNDPAIEVAQIILCGAIWIENQAIRANQRAVVHCDRRGPGAKAVRPGVWKASLHRELDIRRQSVGGYRDGSR